MCPSSPIITRSTTLIDPLPDLRLVADVGLEFDSYDYSATRLTSAQAK